MPSDETPRFADDFERMRWAHQEFTEIPCPQGCPHCASCSAFWPCDASLLITERDALLRLTREQAALLRECREVLGALLKHAPDLATLDAVDELDGLGRRPCPLKTPTIAEVRAGLLLLSRLPASASGNEEK